MFLFFSVPSSPPSNVIFTHRSKTQLTISWRAPLKSSLNGKLTGYQVCYSDKAIILYPKCSSPFDFWLNAQSSSAVIKNLRPSTKYFVTVAAGTNAGYGTKSAEISKITNGGKTSS